MGEITLRDIYDIIDKRMTSLEKKVEDYHDIFRKFEEGKVSDLIERVTKLEKDNEMLKQKDIGFDKKSEKRKEWIWGAIEKVLFIIIGLVFTIVGLVLTKLGIINFNS